MPERSHGELSQWWFGLWFVGHPTAKPDLPIKPEGEERKETAGLLLEAAEREAPCSNSAGEGIA